MRILKSLTPPVVSAALKRLTPASAGALFDGDDALFKETLRGAKRYAEYGVGQSTDWVFAHTSATIRSVDTSRQWIDKVLEDKGGDPRIAVEWVDLGPLGAWGTPLGYSRRAFFRDYVESPWRCAEKPDVVLVDGRFRVACFLFSLLSAEIGCKILFDDYRDRPAYHVVEELLSPAARCGRQALFVAPDVINRENVTAMIENFLYVMD